MAESIPLQSMGKRDIHNEPIREGDVVEVLCERSVFHYHARGYVCHNEEAAYYTGWDSQVIQMLDGSYHYLNHDCPMEILGSMYELSGLLKL